MSETLLFNPALRPCRYGHMDFTFAVKEDIRLFVLSKLRNPLPG